MNVITTFVYCPIANALVPDAKEPVPSASPEDTVSEPASAVLIRRRKRSRGPSVQSCGPVDQAARLPPLVPLPGVSSAATSVLVVASQAQSAPTPNQLAATNFIAILDEGDDTAILAIALRHHPLLVGAKIAGYAAARNRIQSTLFLIRMFCIPGDGYTQDAYMKALVAGHESLADQIFEKHLKYQTSYS